MNDEISIWAGWYLRRDIVFFYSFDNRSDTKGNPAEITVVVCLKHKLW